MKETCRFAWVAGLSALLAGPWAPGARRGAGHALPRMSCPMRQATGDRRQDRAGRVGSCARCTAFVKAFDGTFARPDRGWVTYDDQYLYVAIKNWRGPNYSLLSKRGRRPDDVTSCSTTPRDLVLPPARRPRLPDAVQRVPRLVESR